MNFGGGEKNILKAHGHQPRNILKKRGFTHRPLYLQAIGTPNKFGTWGDCTLVYIPR